MKENPSQVFIVPGINIILILFWMNTTGYDFFIKYVFV